MSSFVMELTRQGIRKRHPDADEDEVACQFVEICYGGELAAKLRAYLHRRHGPSESLLTRALSEAEP